MPIDEIVFAVSCSATVTDKFELQLTKMDDQARNWMTMFQIIVRPKTKLKRAFAHSRVFGTNLKAHFLKLNKEMTKMGGKIYIRPIFCATKVSNEKKNAYQFNRTYIHNLSLHDLGIDIQKWFKYLTAICLCWDNQWDSTNEESIWKKRHGLLDFSSLLR